MRLGVYADLVYRRRGSTITTDRAFVRFVTSLPPRVEEVVIFGRLDPEPGSRPYALPSESVRFVPLPYYPRVDAVGQLARAARASCATFARELERLDAVWIFGPHPLALPFAWIARRRGKPLVLGVRQDYPQYIRGRLPGRGWLWAIPAARALERSFRRLARKAPTVAVGEDLARKYAHGEAPVLAVGLSLVRESELVTLASALARSWDDGLQLITVGRLDPEKNPLLLPEILARLRSREPRWRLVAVGDGPLGAAVESRAAKLGVAAALDLPGYVPNGPALWERYRASHAFLHVSLTEGLPQVLFEAQAAGLPIVATRVGGVAAALGEEGALLAPPRDAEAAVDAIVRLTRDPELRRRLIEGGLQRAATETMEAQLDRVASFLRDQTQTARRT